MIGSQFLSHYGRSGFVQHGINAAIIVGALLLIAGTLMIVRMCKRQAVPMPQLEPFCSG